MNKPKDIALSFEEYLNTQKNNAAPSSSAKYSAPTAKHSAPTTQYNAPQVQTKSQGMKQNTAILDSGSTLFSSRTQALLINFTGFEQKKILKFWYDMNTCFGQGRVRQEFGDEPNRQLMIFAASLDQHSYQRLIDNLEERLRKGQEWPPSIAVFDTLTKTPTDKEILDARTNILTLKTPVSRVEKYIQKRKSAKLRTLSEKYIVHDFRTLYFEAFEEVILHNRDVYLNEKESEILNATTNMPKSKTDKEIDVLIENGYKPEGKLGMRLNTLNQLRKDKMKHAQDTENS